MIPLSQYSEPGLKFSCAARCITSSAIPRKGVYPCRRLALFFTSTEKAWVFRIWAITWESPKQLPVRCWSATEDPQDRRSKRIVLTEKGCRTLHKSMDARQEWLNDLATTFSTSEKEQIISVLNILIEKAKQVET
jgi:hypothetical protein